MVKTVSGQQRHKYLPLSDKVTLLPEKAEGKPFGMPLLGSQDMFDVFFCFLVFFLFVFDLSSIGGLPF